MVELLNSKRSDIFLVLSIVRLKMQSEKRKQMRAAKKKLINELIFMTRGMFLVYREKKTKRVKDFRTLKTDRELFYISPAMG